MKLVRINTSANFEADYSFQIMSGVNKLDVDIPPKVGRTLVELSQLIMNEKLITSFVSDGDNIIGLVNDSFSSELFTELGNIANNEVLSVGAFNVPTKYAFPVGAGLLGFLIGRI